MPPQRLIWRASLLARFEPVKSTDVYTDGACKGNPGPGGWGWVVPDGAAGGLVSGSGGAEQTTNQRMELEAVLRAVETLPGPLRIHSDSTYVVNCFNDRWYEGWLKRGWKNSQKKPVANKDLWEPLIEKYLERSNEIEFVWVKGHAGNRWNERADELAVAAAEAVVAALGAKAATGTSSATEPVEPEAPWPVGRALWVTGAAQPTDKQRAELQRILNGLDPANDLIVSGLRRGVELAAAELARSRRMELAVVLPFADPAMRWPQHDRERFDSVLAAASYVVVLEGDNAAPGAAVAKRNTWVLGRVIGVVAVGDAETAAAAEAADLTVIAVE